MAFVTKFLIPVLSISLGLAGCVSSGSSVSDETHRAVKAAQLVCMEARTSNVTKARCLKQAEAPMVTLWRGNEDLFSDLMAQRIAISERIDRKELTLAEGQALIARAYSSSNSAAIQRNNARRLVAAQEMAATPQFVPTPTQSLYCSKFGTSISCW